MNQDRNSEEWEEIIILLKPSYRSDSKNSNFIQEDLRIGGKGENVNRVDLEQVISTEHYIVSESNGKKKLEEICTNFKVKSIPRYDQDYTIITVSNENGTNTKYKIFTILVCIEQLNRLTKGNCINMLTPYFVRNYFPSTLIKHAMIKSVFRQVCIIPIFESKMQDGESIYNIVLLPTGMVNEKNDHEEYSILNEHARPRDPRTNYDIAKKKFLDHFPLCRFFRPSGFFGFKVPTRNEQRPIYSIIYVQHIPSKHMLPQGSELKPLEYFNPHKEEDDYVDDIMETQVKPQSYAIVKKNYDYLYNYIDSSSQ